MQVYKFKLSVGDYKETFYLNAENEVHARQQMNEIISNSNGKYSRYFTLIGTVKSMPKNW